MPIRGCDEATAFPENISSIFHQKINGEPQCSSLPEDPTARQWPLHLRRKMVKRTLPVFASSGSNSKKKARFPRIE